jgi:hypothetical protein
LTVARYLDKRVTIFPLPFGGGALDAPESSREIPPLMRRTIPSEQRPRTIGCELLSKAERTALFEIVSTAQGFLSGALAPIAMAEIVARLSCWVNIVKPERFLPFVVIWSESDDRVLFDPSLWASSSTADRMVRREEYESRVRVEMPAYGETLIAVCVPLLNQCPVCAFEGNVPPYDAAGAPSHETCRACGFFFDDLDTESDWIEWRRKWIANGMPFASSPAPIGWTPPRSFSL